MNINPKNERLKRSYLVYLKEARRLDEQSLDHVAKALDRFEIHTKRRDFRDYHPEQAIAFKRNLAQQTSVRTGEKLSKATVYSTLTALKEFFFWLAGQPGFKSRLTYSDANYFNASLKDGTLAKAERAGLVPTLDQIRLVLSKMPTETAVDRRNRALIACAILTGARDNALASTRLKHVDLDERQLHHDGRDMRTKFAKSFPTYFFPAGEAIEQILRDWVSELHDQEGFGAEDPLFPPIRIRTGENGDFERAGFARHCWSNATPIRKIFAEAFAGAGLPSYKPHSFRKTLVQLGLEIGIGEAGLKAWSQNMGHDGVLVTLKSYGDIPAHRQKELIRAAAHANNDDALAMKLGRQALQMMRSTGAA